MTTDEKLQTLVQSLLNPNLGYTMRRNIYKELYKIDSPQVVDILCSELIQEGNDHKYYITRLLGHLGDKRAVEPLINLFDDNQQNIVADGIAEALGQIGDLRAVDFLIAALKSPSASLYSKSATALAKLNDKRAIDPLIELFNTARSNRGHIGDALRQFKDPSTISVFIAGLHDSFWNVQVACAKALGEFQDSQAIQPLMQAYNPEFASVQVAILNALGEISHPSTTAFCTDALYTDSDITTRISAADALRKIGTDSSHDILYSALNHLILEVRQATALALLFMGNEDGLHFIDSLLKHPRGEIKQYAIYGLSMNGSPRALQLLDVYNFPVNLTPPPYSRFGAPPYSGFGAPKDMGVDDTWQSW